MFKIENVVPQEVARSTVDNILEFNRANPLLRVKKKPTELSDPVRCPKDFYTIQVDAGCYPNGFLVLGCVIKDSEKKIIFSACKKLQNSADPSVAEAMKIRWGLQLVHDLKASEDHCAIKHPWHGGLYQSDYCCCSLGTYHCKVNSCSE